MGKLGVYTRYSIGNTEYASYVLGDNMDDIQQKIALRGLNEYIESSLQEIEAPIQRYSELGHESFVERIAEITHWACFMSWIAVNAKRTNPDSVLGDKGVLHELIHLMSNSSENTESNVSYLRTLLSQLEDAAVGFY